MSDIPVALENTLNELSLKMDNLLNLTKTKPTDIKKKISELLLDLEKSLEKYVSHTQTPEIYGALLSFIENMRDECKLKAFDPLKHRLTSYKGRLCARLAESAHDKYDHQQAYVFYSMAKHEFSKNTAHHNYTDKAEVEMASRMLDDLKRSVRYDHRFDFKKTLAEIHQQYPTLQKTKIKNEITNSAVGTIKRVGMLTKKPAKKKEKEVTVSPKRVI